MFKFVKVKPRLLGFGVVGGELRRSDPEKTVLDFVYLWKYNGLPDQRIIQSVKEWMNGIDVVRLRDYSQYYPKTVVRQLEGVLP